MSAIAPGTEVELVAFDGMTDDEETWVGQRGVVAEPGNSKYGGRPPTERTAVQVNEWKACWWPTGSLRHCRGSLNIPEAVESAGQIITSAVRLAIPACRHHTDAHLRWAGVSAARDVLSRLPAGRVFPEYGEGDGSLGEAIENKLADAHIHLKRAWDENPTATTAVLERYGREVYELIRARPGVQTETDPRDIRIAELEGSVREWLCESCNTVYPPRPRVPGKAITSQVCPKCKRQLRPTNSDVMFAESRQKKAEEKVSDWRDLLDSTLANIRNTVESCEMTKAARDCLLLMAGNLERALFGLK